VWLDDGVATVPGHALCGEVEERARPWLFASDRPDESVAAWIARGGGDLLWELLGPTRAQVLGIAARLRDGTTVRFGGRVVKNVAGYDLARTFCGARGELGEILEAHLRLRPAPRGWRAAVRAGTTPEEACAGPGAAVWADGVTVRFLRRGEPTPWGYEERDPLEARASLRPAWRRVRSLVPLESGERGVVVAGARAVGIEREPPQRSGALWERLRAAFA
jgi:FAD/FMN-containing dehydrogenase